MKFFLYFVIYINLFLVSFYLVSKEASADCVLTGQACAGTNGDSGTWRCALADNGTRYDLCVVPSKSKADPGPAAESGGASDPRDAGVQTATTGQEDQEQSTSGGCTTTSCTCGTSVCQSQVSAASSDSIRANVNALVAEVTARAAAARQADAEAERVRAQAATGAATNEEVAIAEAAAGAARQQNQAAQGALTTARNTIAVSQTSAPLEPNIIHSEECTGEGEERVCEHFYTPNDHPQWGEQASQPYNAKDVCVYLEPGSGSDANCGSGLVKNGLCQYDERVSQPLPDTACRQNKVCYKSDPEAGANACVIGVCTGANCTQGGLDEEGCSTDIAGIGQSIDCSITKPAPLSQANSALPKYGDLNVCIYSTDKPGAEGSLKDCYVGQLDANLKCGPISADNPGQILESGKGINGANYNIGVCGEDYSTKTCVYSHSDDSCYVGRCSGPDCDFNKNCRFEPGLGQQVQCPNLEGDRVTAGESNQLEVYAIKSGGNPPGPVNFGGYKVTVDSKELFIKGSIAVTFDLSRINESVNPQGLKDGEKVRFCLGVPPQLTALLPGTRCTSDFTYKKPTN